VKRILFCIVLLFCIACSVKKPTYSIGIDKNWYSIALNGQQAFLNGFIKDLLLEIAKENKIEIKLREVNWDDIFDGLKLNRYQAIFSALEPYNFNKAKYDFSYEIIKTGYVLVIGKQEDYENLEDMKNKHVGYLRGEDSLVILQKYVNIFDEVYASVSVMLEDITKLKIEGAILSIIPANKFVSDLFSEELKIVYPPVNDQAVRLLTLKDQNKELLDLFNKTLEKFHENGKIKELEVKWGLPN